MGPLLLSNAEASLRCPCVICALWLIRPRLHSLCAWLSWKSAPVTDLGTGFPNCESNQGVPCWGWVSSLPLWSDSITKGSRFHPSGCRCCAVSHHADVHCIPRGFLPAKERWECWDWETKNFPTCGWFAVPSTCLVYVFGYFSSKMATRYYKFDQICMLIAYRCCLLT